MTKTKKTILIIIIVVLVFAIAFWYISTRIYSFSSGNKIETVTIANQKFHAEIVSSDEKLQKGLGGRDGLCQSCGMLFEFSRVGKYPFWMKDMRFPLDIIWISNGEIVHIEKNVSEKFSSILAPQLDVDHVLEINASISDKFGIKTGDTISF